MASYTTNYNLKKPAAGENYSVNDQNGNMDLIDAAMKALNDAFGSRAFSLEASGVNGVTTIQSGADLNTYTTPGTYVCTNATIFDSLLNTPATMNDSGNAKLIVNINATGYGQQILFRGISIWMRFLTASNWNTWKCVYNSQTLSPLATWESSYSPSGSGSGAYRRGSMIELVYVKDSAVSIASGTKLGTVAEGYRCLKSHYIPIYNFTSGVPLNGSVWFNASNGELTYYGDAITSTKVTFHDTWLL